MSQVNRDALATMLRQFRKQGKPSINNRGSCAYRGDDNTKCAVGSLIPDKKYHFGLETKPLSTITLSFDKKFEKVDFIFLRYCQRIHDSSVPKWETSEKSFAHVFLQELKPIVYMYTPKNKQRNK